MKPCILIGGKSTRMGRDKALIPVAGQPNAQRIADLAARLCQTEAVFLGDPRPGLSGPFLPDREREAGPLSAILGAFDGLPSQTLLVLACDLPHLDEAALSWLLAQGSKGESVWPRFPDSPYLEPLLGIYQPNLLPLLEAAFQAGTRSLNPLASQLSLISPEIPGPLCKALTNANTPSAWPDRDSD
ncbi:MAG: molybdenum cofactor guanylyltransferase [Acidobacteria bacterium]|nr:molybdenum cofactor guanylyltransferase [Acidobacteriota bacterium]MCB9397909.1 molybdenum cofactor guanylyltransferase [Acidobacteriota bacterium]